MAGDSGVVIKTVNGGANWEQSASGTTANLYGIHIFQPLVIYAVGEGGLVLQSDNGGDTWSSSSPIQVRTPCNFLNFDMTFAVVPHK